MKRSGNRKAQRPKPGNSGGPSFIYAPDVSPAAVVGFGSDHFRVMEIDRAEAVAIIKANHYSRTVYNASRVHLGVFAPELLGVLQFGPAMNPASMASVVAGTAADEYCELNRMWLDDALPRNSESMAMSYALKYLKRKFPRLAWVQSFADERCRCFGVVYQACNFVYCGEHSSTFWELDGRFYHNSIMTDGRNASSPSGRRLRENRERAKPHKLRQFRYIYFLRRGFRERLRFKVRPYPKHASEGSTASRFVSNEKGRVRIPHDAPLLMTHKR